MPVDPSQEDSYLPLSEVVYRRIRRGIVRGDFPFSSSLSETDIARRLAVSKTPVREALRRLSQEGLVITTPHKGAVVASLTSQDLEEIYLMRSRLESLAARFAAERLTAEDAKALAAVVEELEVQTSAGDTEAIRRINIRLHQLIWQASHTTRLTQTLMNLQDYVEMSRSALLWQPRGAEVLLDEHGSMVRAVLDRDPDRAEEMVVRHIAHILEVLRLDRRPRRAESEGSGDEDAQGRPLR
jgi:DNA-binding GntR family transcriptional regulator